MTRRQAIQQILSYLDTQENLSEDMMLAKELLREFLISMPGKIWNDRKIREALNQYIMLFHHAPSVKDLDTTPSLPCHTIIANYYKMSAAKWLAENYPPKEYGRRNRGQPYDNKYPDKEELKVLFRREFERINPSGSLTYNQMRSAGTPSWQYIAKRVGVKTWVSLKELCKVKQEQPRRGELAFTMTSHEQPMEGNSVTEKALTEEKALPKPKEKALNPWVKESPYICVRHTVLLQKNGSNT